MSDAGVTTILRAALDDATTAEELRALARLNLEHTYGDPRPYDEQTIEEILKGFVVIVREALEGGADQRRLFLETAVPAILAQDDPIPRILQSSSTFLVLVASALARRVPDGSRAEATVWLAKFIGEYLRDLTTVCLAHQQT